MGAIAWHRLWQRVCPRLQAPEHPHSAGNSYGEQSGVLAARLQHRGSLNDDVTEEAYVKMAHGYDEFDENGVPLMMSPFKSLLAGGQQTGGKNRGTSRGHWPQKSQVEPLCLHLLGEQHHLDPDPVR